MMIIIIALVVLVLVVVLAAVVAMIVALVPGLALSLRDRAGDVGAGVAGTTRVRRNLGIPTGRPLRARGDVAGPGVVKAARPGRSGSIAGASSERPHRGHGEGGQQDCFTGAGGRTPEASFHGVAKVGATKLPHPIHGFKRSDTSGVIPMRKSELGIRRTVDRPWCECAG